MSRRPSTKPWLHAASRLYCITLGGKRHYLDRDFKVACQKLKRLQSEAKKGTSVGQQDWLDANLIDLVNEFLDDIKARRRPGTYLNCRERLLRGLKIIGTEMRVGHLRRFHLAKIEQVMTGKYSSATIRDTLATLQQVFNFAVRNDMLDFSPIVGYRKPAGGNRTRTVTPGEFQKLLRVADPCFRRFLLALKLTGCRPIEARTLTWEMVDLENGFWIIPNHKTINMQREPLPRVIPLPEKIWKLCKWLKTRCPATSNHVFLNCLVKPYGKDTLVRKMARVRVAAGIEKKAGENLVLYSNRHAYATEGVGKVSDTELASLMGHTTTRTLRRYVHLNPQHLREIQRRVQQ